MKLYTEEQVDIMLSRARMQKQDDTYMFTNEYLLSQETPIELPDNDEDAGKIALYISSVRDEEKAIFIIAGAMKYNEWIRYKILNQNK